MAFDLPLLRQGVGQLKRFDVVERFLEDKQAIGLAHLGPHLRPGVIRVRSADRDLEFGVNLPDARDRFDPVPTRWHAHVHEGHRVRARLGEGLLDQFKRLLALHGGIQLKGCCGVSIHGGSIEQHRGSLGDLGGHTAPAAKYLSEIFVDRRIVVDDQNAVVGPEQGCVRRVHIGCVASMAAGSSATGSSRVKVAPLPGPSLWAARLPPISVAALALLCRPKPSPSFRVVNPWRKIRARLSSLIPMPLSRTAIVTPPRSLASMMISRRLSSGVTLSMACLALLNTLIRI